MEWICKGEVQTVAVYSRDRLTRFGGELIDFISNLFDTVIVYVENDKSEDLSKDLLTIITQYYGSRKYVDEDD